MPPGSTLTLSAAEFGDAPDDALACRAEWRRQVDALRGPHQADEIRKARVAAGENIDAYQAAALAAAARDTHLARGVSFVTETVFSHPSKLELIEHAQSKGFRVVLYHVNVASADIAVARVRWRAHQGGHDVAEDKIRARYARNQVFIQQAASRADLTLVFDSSRAHAPARWLLTFRRGRIREVSDNLPEWATVLYRL